MLLHAGNVVAEGFELAVAYFSHAPIVALALGTLCLKLEVLRLFLVRLNAGEEFFLALPLGAEGFFALLQIGDFAVEAFEFLLIVFALDGLALDFELAQAARDFVEFLGLRVALHAEFGSSLVHEVDGLVGQETLVDVAMREIDGGNDGIVLNTHVVVVLIFLFQAAENGNGVFGRRLVHRDRLEAALECLVFFEILLIFLQSGGPDAAQFAACQRRLEDIGGVHSALALARPDERVDFVDEENDAALGLRHFVDDAFEAFLKFSLVLRASHERAHVERVELLVF